RRTNVDQDLKWIESRRVIEEFLHAPVTQERVSQLKGKQWELSRCDCMCGDCYEDLRECPIGHFMNVLYLAMLCTTDVARESLLLGIPPHGDMGRTFLRLTRALGGLRSIVHSGWPLFEIWHSVAVYSTPIRERRAHQVRMQWLHDEVDPVLVALSDNVCERDKFCEIDEKVWDFRRDSSFFDHTLPTSCSFDLREVNLLQPLPTTRIPHEAQQEDHGLPILDHWRDPDGKMKGETDEVHNLAARCQIDDHSLAKRVVLQMTATRNVRESVASSGRTTSSTSPRYLVSTGRSIVGLPDDLVRLEDDARDARAALSKENEEILRALEQKFGLLLLDDGQEGGDENRSESGSSCSLPADRPGGTAPTAGEEGRERFEQNGNDQNVLYEPLLLRFRHSWVSGANLAMSDRFIPPVGLAAEDFVDPQHIRREFFNQNS
ncbi:unnamed protein product, partial [Amoebophrya sp. A25]